MKLQLNERTITVAEGCWNEWWHRYGAGLWEPNTFRIFDTLITSRTTYLDVGAWIGPTVLYAAQLAKICYAIEPDPVAYGWLVENVKASGAQNIRTFNTAFLAHEGTETFGSEDKGNSQSRVGYGDNSFVACCGTLARFVAVQALAFPLFIKMDVEGAEEIILTDAEFFERCKPTLYVSLHPFWFKNEAAGLEIIRRIGRLYKYQYNERLERVDIEAPACGAYVFTDREI